jgi:hypothetical protein
MAERFDPKDLSGDLIKAARVLARMRVEDLAADSLLGVATVRRAEAVPGKTSLTAANAARIVQALEARGVIFIPADAAGGEGVRLRLDASQAVNKQGV